MLGDGTQERRRTSDLMRKVGKRAVRKLPGVYHGRFFLALFHNAASDVAFLCGGMPVHSGRGSPTA